MLKILDRYIIRQFLGGFVFAITLMVSIAMTIDIGEHLGKFVQHNLSISQVFTEFYIYFIPSIITFLGPYFIFITVIYFTSRLANKSEIIAMFNSGMSFKRLLVPYILTSTVVACILWYVINFIVPHTDKKRLAFENKYIAWTSSASEANIHRRIDDSTFFYFRVYDHSMVTAFNVSIEKIKNGKLESKTLAEKATYDTTIQLWNLKNYFTRTMDASGKETITKGDSFKPFFKLDPTILVKRWTHIQELDRAELKGVIADLKAQGSEGYKPYQLELYKRTSKCFGIIILTIIGVILASKKFRGGIGIHLMLGLALGSVYEVVVKFADSFAIKANFDLLLASWLPNLIYMILAYFLWKKIQE